MTDADLAYIRKLLAAGKLFSPVLELGAGYGGKTSSESVRAAGLEYKTTDLSHGPGIDFAADFEADDCLNSFLDCPAFGSVLVLNVLEHVFDPVKVLDNALRLVKPGGTLVVITPVVWPVHNFPRDYQRLLPDWYLTFAATRGCRLVEEWFEFLGYGAVASFRQPDSEELQLPQPTRSRLYFIYSKVVHKVFNTFGRGMWAPSHCAIGAVFEKPA